MSSHFSTSTFYRGASSTSRTLRSLTRSHNCTSSWRSAYCISLGTSFRTFSSSHTDSRTFLSSTSRSIIKIDGPDTLKYVQGLTTNNVTLLEGQNTSKAMYTCLLNAQGRILFDAFLFRPSNEESLWMDFDATLLDHVLKHLRRFKVRSKVNFTDLSSDYRIWTLFGSGAERENLSKLDGTFFSHLQAHNAYILTDTRIGSHFDEAEDQNVEDKPVSTLGMGLRIVAPSSVKLETLINPSIIRHVNPSAYQLFRTFRGLPEGPVDLPIGEMFPFECNMDYLNAVAYNKGCYIGQELTARTHYTGVVRKRLFPVQIDQKDPTKKESVAVDSSLERCFDVIRKMEPGESPVLPIVPPQTPLLTEDGKKTGRTFSGVADVSLAMVRLEHLKPQNPFGALLHTARNDPSLNPANPSAPEVDVRVTAPEWWSSYVRDQKEIENKQSSQSYSRFKIYSII